jgi:hypothetical protein
MIDGQNCFDYLKGMTGYLIINQCETQNKRAKFCLLVRLFTSN